MSATHRIVRLPLAAGLAFGIGSLSLRVGARADSNGFLVTNLVSDGAVPAAHTDPHLVNPWGIAFNPNGYVWVADADSGYSTLYDGNGLPQPLVVSIPDPDGNPAMGHPTGIVYYGGAGFLVGNNPSRFIFVGEDGNISGWAPGADMTHALNAVITDGSLKGLAIATGTPNGDAIYVADFGGGAVRTFDSKFGALSLPFTDPNLPDGFSPFGIQMIGSTVYVAYALRDPDTGDEVAGPHMGYVDAFDTSGNMLRRVVGGGPLNAPWGIAMAPKGFGPFGGALLVGNFGDGKINAFNPDTGVFLGTLENPGGGDIQIEGLWGIAFGNGLFNQPTDTLFFAAGINGEADGLYGSISAAGCYADTDGNGTLDLFDYLGFVNLFNGGNLQADCDGSGSLDLFDFLCFTNAFNAGC